jgi:hypothetical protein
VSAYPHLVLAIVELLYDNGCVNAASAPVETQTQNVMDLLVDLETEEELNVTEDFLASLWRDQTENKTTAWTDFLTGEDVHRTIHTSEDAATANVVLDDAFELL